MGPGDPAQFLTAYYVMTFYSIDISVGACVAFEDVCLQNTCLR